MLVQLGLPLLSALVLSQPPSAQLSIPIRLGKGADQISVSLEPEVGLYSVFNEKSGWRFSGRLGSPATHEITRRGRDTIGTYQELIFDWDEGVPVRGVIRSYDLKPMVWFRAHYLRSVKGKGFTFPEFKVIANGLESFSYKDQTFSPPTFGLAKTSTPWMLFDHAGRSVILSPASNFMVATVTGDIKTQIGVGLNDRLTQVPGGFDQDSLMAFADGIGSGWDRWGSAMRTLFHKKVPANDSDTLLKSFGYWTDNGADYYYNYDPKLGYANTLVELVKRYRDEGVPLGYLQLDSWWYQKSTLDPTGRRGGAKKNNRLPIGSWNRYGGLMEYRANPDLFPDGLSRFQKAVGLPLAVHNRWIDRTSPYHDKYKISGVGAVDQKWWLDTAAYLKQNGVVCYEQDWLDEIYMNSPEMATRVGVGDAFTDGMASACKDAGLSMQYCMGTPRFFLEGLKYSNLTTIRTSGDRFEPGEWANFLYVSRFAHEVGVWPWCDVFKSGETANMILSVLSAGPVGTGDLIGKENKVNILQAVRPDGVIVKPDQPLLPCDRTYLDASQHKLSPFIASTYTEHSGVRTTYVFAFPRPKGERSTTFHLSEFGIKTGAYVVNQLTRVGNHFAPTDDVPIEIGKDGFVYLMIAPDTRSGIVLLGDLGKFVSTGKQRIVSMSDVPNGLTVKINFAKGEESVFLELASAHDVLATSKSGSAKMIFDNWPGRTAFEVSPKPGTTSAEITFSASKSVETKMP